MTVFQFQDQIARRLLQWSAASVAVGVLLRLGNRFWRNMGGQFIAWGLIDGLIAIGGQMSKRSRIDHMENPGNARVQQEEAQNLGRLLWFNAALDVLYVIGGYLWARRDRGDGQARGNGWGIIVQGTFLLLFDVFHAQQLPIRKD